jgi:hypothetical protein
MGLATGSALEHALAFLTEQLSMEMASVIRWAQAMVSE